jgi:RNA polymerase sigma-70 factor (ECF subfamily)
MPHLDAMYAMALRLTANPADAEDLVQDALVKSYRFFHRYQEGSNIKAWLFKVMVNLFYNNLRKAKKDRRLQVEAASESSLERIISEASAAGGRPEQLLLGQLTEERMRQAVDELPEEFRVAVLLCDLYDFSYKEIAEILDCPVGTVMSRLYRGRRILQSKLFEYAVEQGIIRPPETGQGPAADLEAYRKLKGRS